MATVKNVGTYKIGPAAIGETLELDEASAQWLVDHGVGQLVETEAKPEHKTRKPRAHKADAPVDRESKIAGAVDEDHDEK